MYENIVRVCACELPTNRRLFLNHKTLSLWLLSDENKPGRCPKWQRFSFASSFFHWNFSNHRSSTTILVFFLSFAYMARNFQKITKKNLNEIFASRSQRRNAHRNIWHLLWVEVIDIFNNDITQNIFFATDRMNLSGHHVCFHTFCCRLFTNFSFSFNRLRSLNLRIFADFFNGPEKMSGCLNSIQYHTKVITEFYVNFATSTSFVLLFFFCYYEKKVNLNFKTKMPFFFANKKLKANKTIITNQRLRKTVLALQKDFFMRVKWGLIVWVLRLCKAVRISLCICKYTKSFDASEQRLAFVLVWIVKSTPLIF